MRLFSSVLVVVDDNDDDIVFIVAAVVENKTKNHCVLPRNWRFFHCMNVITVVLCCCCCFLFLQSVYTLFVWNIVSFLVFLEWYDHDECDEWWVCVCVCTHASVNECFVSNVLNANITTKWNSSFFSVAFFRFSSTIQKQKKWLQHVYKWRKHDMKNWCEQQHFQKNRRRRRIHGHCRMRVCFQHFALYLYNCLCSVRGTGKQSSGANLHERVRWMRKLAHHFLFCPVAVFCTVADQCAIYTHTHFYLVNRFKCVYFLRAHKHAHARRTRMYAFISSIFSHSTRNFRSYVFTKLEAYAKYLCNINDFYRLVNGFHSSGNMSVRVNLVTGWWFNCPKC